MATTLSNSSYPMEKEYGALTGAKISMRLKLNSAPLNCAVGFEFLRAIDIRLLTESSEFSELHLTKIDLVPE